MLTAVSSAVQVPNGQVLANATAGALHKGAFVALNLLVDTVGASFGAGGIRQSVAQAPNRVRTSVDKKIDAALKAIPFLPPNLGGKLRWNILGRPQEFKWKREDGVV